MLLLGTQRWPQRLGRRNLSVLRCGASGTVLGSSQVPPHTRCQTPPPARSHAPSGELLRGGDRRKEETRKFKEREGGGGGGGGCAKEELSYSYSQCCFKSHTYASGPSIQAVLH